MSVKDCDRQIELLRVPRVPEYDVITNFDSKTAATSLPGLVLRWLVQLLLSWEVFVVASATCASGVILSDDFAKSRPRYLQSTASATPRRYFASTSAYFSSMDPCPRCAVWGRGAVLFFCAALKNARL